MTLTNLLEPTTLPLYLPPPMTYSLYLANKLSIIMCNEDGLSWLYNNFIQLVFSKDILEETIDPTMNFKTHFLTIWPTETLSLDQRGGNLLLRESSITDKVLELNEDNLIHQIKKWIDNGLYIIANVDVSQLTTTRYWGQKPFCHSSFLYGYHENELYQLDFDKQGNFSTVRIPNQDFINAFFSKDLERILMEEKKMNVKYNLTLIELKDGSKATCEIKKEVIKYWVKAYLDSEDCSIPSDFLIFSQNKVCGMAVYDYLIEFIKKLAKVSIMDYRMLTVLHEHKKMMLMRVQKLVSESYIVDQYELILQCDEMLQLTQDIIHLGQKYQEYSDNKYIIQMIDFICDLKIRDEKFMKDFLSALS